jgi:uncharacterized protein
MRLNPLPYMQEQVRGMFLRKPNRFLTRLHEQTTIVVAGTAALMDYLDSPTPTHAARVKTLEHAADDVRRQLIGELNQTFVTPIDREDLFSLSRAIDDVLDHIYSTTTEMEILRVSSNESLRSIARLLCAGAVELHHAVEHLEKDTQIADAHAFHVKKIANQGETWYAEALAALFTEPNELAGIMPILKLREIYQHMSSAVDSTEQAADIISDIIVKLY